MLKLIKTTLVTQNSKKDKKKKIISNNENKSIVKKINVNRKYLQLWKVKW